MTPEQFEALAQLMRLRQSASREALRLVLVDGLTHAAAAEQTGRIRTDVTQAVTSARRAIELARTAAGCHTLPLNPSSSSTAMPSSQALAS